MGFRENLKEELSFNGMLIKELALASGVHKRAIDTYLRTNASMPPADTAVKIAQALGVSVEYLVTGDPNRHPPADPRLSKQARKIGQYVDQLDERNRQFALNFIKLLITHQNT